MELIVGVYRYYMIQENHRLFRKPPLLGPHLVLARLLLLILMLSILMLILILILMLIIL